MIEHVSPQLGTLESITQMISSLNLERVVSDT